MDETDYERLLSMMGSTQNSTTASINDNNGNDHMLMDTIQNIFENIPHPINTNEEGGGAFLDDGDTLEWLTSFVQAQNHPNTSSNDGPPSIYGTQCSPLTAQQQQQLELSSPSQKSASVGCIDFSTTTNDIDRPRTFPMIVRTLHRDNSNPNILSTPSPPGILDGAIMNGLGSSNTILNDVIGTVIKQKEDQNDSTILYTPTSNNELLAGGSTANLLNGIKRPSPLDMSGFNNPQIFDNNLILQQQQYHGSSDSDTTQYGMIEDYLTPDPMTYYGSRSPSPAVSEESDMYSDSYSDTYEASNNRMAMPFSLPASPSDSLLSLPILLDNNMNGDITRSNDFLDPSSAAGDSNYHRSRRCSGSLGLPLTRRRSRSASSVRSTSSKSGNSNTEGARAINGNGHSKEPLRCEICGKEFPRKFNLTSHLVSHTSERPYPCSYCEKSFKRKPDLYRHERMVHVPFGCDRCRNRFATDDALRSHLCQASPDGGVLVPGSNNGGINENDYHQNGVNRTTALIPTSPLAQSPLLSQSLLRHPPNISPSGAELSVNHTVTTRDAIMNFALEHNSNHDIIQQPHYTKGGLVGFDGKSVSPSKTNLNVYGLSATSNGNLFLPIANVDTGNPQNGNSSCNS